MWYPDGHRNSQLLWNLIEPSSHSAGIYVPTGTLGSAGHRTSDTKTKKRNKMGELSITLRTRTLGIKHVYPVPQVYGYFFTVHTSHVVLIFH